MAGEFEQSSDLRVELFGGPRVFKGDSEIPLTPFQSYLVAIVYGHGPRGVSRTKVAHLLWDTDLDSRARHRISQLLYGVKERVGRELIAVEQEFLVPDSDVAACRYVRLWKKEEVTDAVTERFLADLLPPFPTKNLEDWYRATQILADRDARRANEELVAKEFHRGNFFQVETLASKIAQIDPNNPYIIEQRVKAIACQGRAVEAQRFLSGELRRLRHDSSPPNQNLLHELNSNLARMMEAGQKNVRERPPLIGRNEEVTRLIETYPPNDLSCKTVVIGGEPGIGKSEVLQTLSRRQVLEGWDVVSVECRRGELSIPFNAIGDLLEQSPFPEVAVNLQSPWRDILFDTFPTLAESGETASIALRQYPTNRVQVNARRLLEAVSRLVRTVTDRKALALHLDDFQWIDAGSAAALRFMQRRLAKQPLGFFLSLRTEEIRFTDGIRSYVNQFCEDADGWIELDILDATDTREIVAAVAPSLSRDLVDRASHISGGVPLFAIELAQEYEDRQRRGLSIDETHTIESIRGIYEGRLRRLSSLASNLIKVCAVIDRPVVKSELAELAGITHLQLAQALEELVTMRLVSVSDAELVDFGHQMIQRTLYHSLSQVERELIHRQVAEYAKEYEKPNASYEIAHHAHLAGMGSVAYDAAVAGSKTALDRGDVSQAVKLIRIACETASNSADRAKDLALLGHLLGLSGEYREAAPILGQASQLAHKVGQRDQAYLIEIEALRAKMESDVISTAEAREVIARIRTGCQRVGSAFGVAQSLDLEMRLADYSLDLSTAQRILRDVEEIQAKNDHRLECLVELIKTRHLCYGSPAEARSAAREALRLTQEFSLDEEVGIALKRFVVVFMYQGLLNTDESQSVVKLAQDAHLRTGDLQSLFDVLINVGVWLLDTGHEDRASQYFKDAGKIVDAFEQSPERAVLDINVAEGQFWQGDFAGAREGFQSALGSLTTVRRKANWVAKAGLALCEIALGNLRHAKELEAGLPASSSLIRAPTFDPSLIALLRARLAEIEGRPNDAVDLLMNWSDALSERIVPACLKIMLSEVRVRRKHKLDRIEERSQIGKGIADSLGLKVRAREFERYL